MTWAPWKDVVPVPGNQHLRRSLCWEEGDDVVEVNERHYPLKLSAVLDVESRAELMTNTVDRNPDNGGGIC